MLSILDGEDVAVDVGLHFYRLDKASGVYEPLELAAGEFPFIMEAPYVLAPGMESAWVFTGTAGTEYLARLLPPEASGRESIEVSGTLPTQLDSQSVVRSLELPADYPAGSYRYELLIRKPGEPQLHPIDATNTPAGPGVPATLEVVTDLTLYTGAQISAFLAANKPVHPAVGGGTGWGLTEY